MGATLLGTIVYIVLHWHSGRRAKRQRHLDACIAFRKEFSELQAAMRKGGAGLAGHYWWQPRVRHEEAIVEFTPYLPWYHSRGFKRACGRFRECKKAYLQYEGGVQTPRDPHCQEKFSAAIHKLVSYADKT